MNISDLLLWVIWKANAMIRVLQFIFICVLFEACIMSNRVCAVSSCKNNGYKLQKWLNTSCEKHQCFNKECDCPRPFRLIPFPTEKKDPETRLKWAKLLQRKGSSGCNWLPKDDSRVCSLHFVDNEPTLENPYPTLNLGYTPTKELKARPPPRRRLIDRSPSKIQKLDTCINSEHASLCNNGQEQNHISFADHNYFVQETPKEESETTTDCDQCLSKNLKINDMKNEIEHLKLENIKLKAILKQKSQTCLTLQTVTKSNKKMKFYTGFPTVKAFMVVYTYILATFKDITYWKGPSRVTANPLKPKRTMTRKLSKKEEIIMTMMKIRLGLLNQDLGDRFGVSATCVSNIISTWIRILGKVIGDLVFNPKKEVVKANLPPSFKTKKYSNVRHIIDCTEVFIEKPSNFQTQSVTWSDYKHHHTIKLLVSITPAGMINFISSTWGGRASDKFVTEQSGFLDILEAYDTVMADRGFPIREELALRHCHLLIPPGRRGVAQMTSTETRCTTEIANHRIYVEQAIRRLKCFRVLKYELPLTMLCHIDDIIKIAGGMCNLYPPLPRYASQ
ncbi:uncharacterized protein [Argopecten irradians]|uniref:uncharacterized protein n=1 Tax=Argopecten irradians TaxID=31199 RepID=UPI003721EF8E